MAELVTPLPGGIKKVKVYKTEEKGSDVNLATHLLNDAHLKDFEMAVVISNDSDLVEPIRIVINELGLRVGVLNPHIKGSHPSFHLKQTATFVRYLRKSDLARSQFPPTMSDTDGNFYKPDTW